ncbi:unnamed protein product [Paramecium sonneborni]|uniref:SIMPL domain-containing protein n=1 Tax=Paramecium sonneborni TaxID=65129 RepID=A0A8S1QVJ8_9CILI|nr:unnamed protein product [Paramecium sonneborni]
MKTFLSISLLFAISYSQFLKPTSGTQIIMQSCGIQEYLLPEIYYVQGTASSIVEPTQAIIKLNIEVKKNKAQEALQQLAVISDKAIKAIQEQSSVELKIQTNDYSIQPYIEYDYNIDPVKLIFEGFKANNLLTIETKNLHEVGKIIDTAVKNGVENINGVNFDISQEQKNKLKDLLIQEAIKDARHTANVVLKQMNMKILSVKSVVINEYYNSDQENTHYQSVTVGYIISTIDQ